MSEYKWHGEKELVDPEDSVFRLSASSVKSHKGCPMKFKLSKIDGYEETKGNDEYLRLGSAVHESIEEVLDRARWRSAGRPQAQLREELMSEFREWNPDVSDDLWDRGIDCIETASKYLSALMGDVDVRDIEEEFDFTLGRPDISAAFKGFIDITTETDEVWDWKTGSIREEAEVIQGAVYMRGYQELYGEPPEKIRFVYLKEGKERALEPNDENWNEMLDHARQLVQDIRREEFVADPEPSKCYWCGYEGFCEASPVGAARIGYQTFRQRGVRF